MPSNQITPLSQLPSQQQQQQQQEQVAYDTELIRPIRLHPFSKDFLKVTPIVSPVTSQSMHGGSVHQPEEQEFQPKMWFGGKALQRTPYNADNYARKRRVTGLKGLKKYAYHLSHNESETHDEEALQEFVETGLEEKEPGSTSATTSSAPNGEAAAPPKGEEENFDDIELSEGLTSAKAKEIFANVGPNTLPEEKKPAWLVFLELLVQPMPIMIWIAIIVEGAIQNWIDFGILIGIQFLNASLSFYETTKAGNAVAALKKSLKPTCVCKRDGEWDHKFDATMLVPGDLIQLEAGNAVPADCIVNDGIVECDESAMTGESLPVTLHKREMAKMGASIARGECEATVVFTGKDTFFGRTAGLLNQGGNERSGLATLLINIMIILVVLSVSLSGIVFAYLATRPSETIKDALSFTVVLIVASIPVAIEIVVTTTLALGSREMSSYGAIVSRLAAIEDMAGMDMLCSDKTGTLTKNKMMIQPMCPLYDKPLCDSQMHLLRHACMAARWEQPPKDALDTLVLRCPLWYDSTVDGMRLYREQWEKENPKATFAEGEEWQSKIIFDKLLEGMTGYERLDYTPFDPKVKRTEAVVRFPDGSIRKVTKGAPHVIGHLDKDPVKRKPLASDVEGFAKDGIRAMAIAVSDPLVGWTPPDPNIPKDPSKDALVVWHLLGLLTFLDPPRDDTFATIRKSEEYGVPVRMVTGDQILIAVKTCKDLQMGRTDREGYPHILGPQKLPLLVDGKPPKNLVGKYGKLIEHADGFAQVFPEHKYLIVQTFRKLGYKTGMTGDGVNDAPALSRADVGIAVAGATDAARAAADIILTKEGLGTIVDAMQTSRKVFQRMKTFLTYRIGATLQLLVFFFIAVLSFQPVHFIPDYNDVKGDYSNKTNWEDVIRRHPHLVHAEPWDWPRYFGMPVLMLMIITLLNDGTLISVGYDYTFPSLRPEKWNMKALFCISSYLGAMSFLSSLLLLHLMLDSNRGGSFFQRVNLGGLTYGQVINGIYLKVSVSDFLTLFASRAQEKYFWSIKPHPILAIAGFISLTITTLLTLFWPKGTLDKIPVEGLVHRPPYGLTFYIWLYCFLVFLLQDFGKTILFKVMYKYNMFNILGLTEHEKKKLLEDKKGPVRDNQILPITHAGSIADKLNDVLANMSNHGAGGGGH